MRKWLLSDSGTIFLSALAYLTFLGRGFLDWRYEYPDQDPNGDWVTPGVLFYMALAGVWLWGLLEVKNGRRRGWILCLVLALLLNVLLALATFFIFCPPWTDCEGWPNAWPWNWSNLVTGLLAVLVTGDQLRRGMPER
jgi:MFS family permease